MDKEKKIIPDAKFKDLGLSKETLEAITKKGFEEPTPIQVLTIPAMLTGTKDIIAQAKTGTGKTAAFGLPLIELIDVRNFCTQALILVPTRELAIQVAEEINSLRYDQSLQLIPVYGGQSIEQQFRRLKKGVHIVVGTPGRIIDHIKRKTLVLDEIKYLVLDEADEMLNMGFIEDIEEIMKHTAEDRRTLLFSATMPERIKQLASKYMKPHEFISVKQNDLVNSLTEQIYYEVKQSERFEVLCRIIDIEDDFYGLIFCRTKIDVDTVNNHLVERGYDSDAIHGDIEQSRREKTLNKFRNRKINILVATDVAARGIDVNDLTHVINYSLPQDTESYIHRIGRTGRAGKRGTAITFISPSEYRKLLVIQTHQKVDIKRSKVPNVEDIIKSKKNKINEELSSIEIQNVDDSYYSWSKKLLENENPTQLVAKILNYCFHEDLDPKAYTSIVTQSDNDRRDTQRSYKDKSQIDDGTARLFVAMGRKDGTSPAKLVQFIIENTGVKNSVIDEVEVFGNFSFITVPFKEAEKILGVFQRKSKDGKSLVVKAKNRRDN